MNAHTIGWRDGTTRGVFKSGFPAALALALVVTLASPEGALAAPHFGIWLTQAELNALPTSGSGWSNVSSRAASSCGEYTLDQFGDANTCYLAAALVCAKTGAAAPCDKAEGGLQSLYNHRLDSAMALDILRETGTAAVIADLIDLPTRNATLNTNIKSTLSYFRDTKVMSSGQGCAGKTMKQCCAMRPNNYGGHCQFSRIAIDLYVRDAAALADLNVGANEIKGWMGESTGYNGFNYTRDDWQVNGSSCTSNLNAGTRCYGINPVGASRAGHSLDGVLPDDQRRDGNFTWPPFNENYTYGALSGYTPAAVLLSRYNSTAYPALKWGNSALLRAHRWNNVDNNFPPNGDDNWLEWIINKCYGTGYYAPSPTQEGKNMGWTDWTHGPGSIVSCSSSGPPPACPACSNSATDCDETDVDCGGSSCQRCADGRSCSTGRDCVSGTCTAGLCTTAPAGTCSDGDRNQDETDIDCGGTICPKCADGDKCKVASDCASGTCTSGLCAKSSNPTCSDEVRNQDETDVDCGGNVCPDCEAGMKCVSPADCETQICEKSLCVSLPAPVLLDVTPIPSTGP